jgi:alanine dehydrogenase
MQTESTLLLNRSDVQELLSPAECIDTVEKVFHRQCEGKTPPSGILGVRTQTGGLHVKTACLSGAKNYIVAKLNTNFPQNYARFGKPTIQGVIVLYDADNGRLLAVLDSIEITIQRTAAATAVAAKFFGRDDLWLWRASPCATSRALSHPFTPKSLRLRYRFKRIAAARCTTIARASDRY